MRTCCNSLALFLRSFFSWLGLNEDRTCSIVSLSSCNASMKVRRTFLQLWCAAAAASVDGTCCNCAGTLANQYVQANRNTCACLRYARSHITAELKTPSDCHCLLSIVYRVVQCTLVHSHADKSATACAGREPLDVAQLFLETVSRLVRNLPQLHSLPQHRVFLGSAKALQLAGAVVLCAGDLANRTELHIAPAMVCRPFVALCCLVWTW